MQAWNLHNMPIYTHWIGTSVKVWQHQAFPGLWNNASSYTLLVGVWIHTTGLEINSALSGQVQMHQPYHPAFRLLCASPRNPYMCASRDKTNIDGNDPLSIKRGMEWRSVVCSYNGVPYGSENECITAILNDIGTSHNQSAGQKHTCCRKMRTVQLHFSEVQRHAQQNNTLFRTASISEETIKKRQRNDKYKIQSN